MKAKGFWSDPEVVRLTDLHRPLMGDIEPKATDHKGFAYCPCPIAVRLREIEAEYQRAKEKAKKGGPRENG